MTLAFPPASREQLRQIEEGAVALLLAWQGLGEIGGNNRVPWLRRLRGGGRDGEAWCASLQWAASDLAARTQLARRYPIAVTASARKLYARIVALGTDVPIGEHRPGDVVCFPRGAHQELGHVARVVRSIGPHHAQLIDGNVGSYQRTRGQVRLYDLDLRAQPLVGIARSWRG